MSEDQETINRLTLALKYATLKLHFYGHSEVAANALKIGSQPVDPSWDIAILEWNENER